MIRLDETIPAALIDAAEQAGACADALAWLREQPRTGRELARHRPEWVRWAGWHGIPCAPEWATAGPAYAWCARAADLPAANVAQHLRDGLELSAADVARALRDGLGLDDDAVAAAATPPTEE
jgi:hypothetical protein